MLKNYRSLTKLRKQEKQRVEMALMEINSKIENLRSEKESLRVQERSLSLPRSGEGVRVLALLSQKGTIKAAIMRVQTQIDALLPVKEELQERLKAANIAFEQAKSMESKVVEDIMKSESRRVQSMLDEIASQQFWRLNGLKKGSG